MTQHSCEDRSARAVSGLGNHRKEEGAKCTEPVIAGDNDHALRDGEVGRVVKEERAATLFKASPVEENHGGGRARAGGWGEIDVEIQAVFGLEGGYVGVVVVLKTSWAKTARILPCATQVRCCEERAR